MFKRVLLPLFVILSFSLNAFAGGSEMKPGKWAITTTTQVPMMGPMDHTMTSCFTKEDLKPQEMMKQENNDCKVKNMKTSGSAVSWEIVCNSQGGEFKGSASATSKPESLSGQMKMSMSVNGRTMNMETKWKGKYLGVCDK